MMVKCVRVFHVTLGHVTPVHDVVVQLHDPVFHAFRNIVGYCCQASFKTESTALYENNIRPISCVIALILIHDI